ncbi:hypothetical protein Tco_0464507 [Tanacetum coccineum]
MVIRHTQCIWKLPPRQDRRYPTNLCPNVERLGLRDGVIYLLVTFLVSLGKGLKNPVDGCAMRCDSWSFVVVLTLSYLVRGYDMELVLLWDCVEDECLVHGGCLIIRGGARTQLVNVWLDGVERYDEWGVISEYLLGRQHGISLRSGKSFGYTCTWSEITVRGWRYEVQYSDVARGDIE